MSTKFKKGDKVKCIDLGNMNLMSPGRRLNKEDTYVVEVTTDTNVKIEGYRTFWVSRRFELVNSFMTQTDLLKDFHV